MTKLKSSKAQDAFLTKPNKRKPLPLGFRPTYKPLLETLIFDDLTEGNFNKLFMGEFND